ncbi:hypothetical protein WK78_03115 [Burkholderia cepacia]|nr:hypothetical protein WK78_03115 [Burkholderia cepacia]
MPRRGLVVLQLTQTTSRAEREAGLLLHRVPVALGGMVPVGRARSRLREAHPKGSALTVIARPQGIMPTNQGARCAV